MGLPYGDPDELDRLAQRLMASADLVRDHAAEHARRGRAARWVSASASAFHDRVDADRRAADRCAAELAEAAAALRAHAQQVRETLALIARIEQQVTGWFDRQARSLLDRAEDVVDAAGRVARRLVDEVPWRTWPIGPNNLPGPGDARWLEVGEFMRKQGVM